MNAIWLATVVLSAPPLDAASADAAAIVSPSESSAEAADPRSRLRQAQDLRNKVSEHLRREATTEDAENRKAIHDLVELFVEVTNDRSLTDDERKRLRGKLRSRLQRVADRLEREVARERKIARREGRLPDSIPDAAVLHEYLAQQLQNFGQAAGGGAAAAGEALIDLIKTTIRPDSWDDNGGPGSAILYGRFGAVRQQLDNFAGKLAAGDVAGAFGGGAGDDGEQLVELIQTVIAPDTWDVNGGPGSIFYYRPLRVLVVRQSSEVHGNVGGVLGQLRDAGN